MKRLKLCFVLGFALPLIKVDHLGGQIGMLTEAASAEDEMRLIQRFLNSSVKNIRPVKDTLDPVRVALDITFHSVIDMDERHQILTTNMWVRQDWQNQFFQWDPSDYGGLKHVIVDSSEVWLPDITLYDNVFEEFDGRLDHIPTRVKINYDGSSRWAAPFVFKSSCHIDVSNFPFDDQYCRLKFSSWQYEGSELDLRNAKNYSGKTKTSVEHGEWEVRNVTIRRNSVEYACCPKATYPDVTFTIHLKRRPLFYIVNLIVPNFLIALLGFFSFFIPVECGERISFVITVLLSMTVFLLMVAENIPATSDAVPIIGVFYMLSIVEIAFALVATGITLKIYYSYLYGHGLSARWKKFLFHKLGPLLRFSSGTGSPKQDAEVHEVGTSNGQCQRSLKRIRRPFLRKNHKYIVEAANENMNLNEAKGTVGVCDRHKRENESLFVEENDVTTILDGHSTPEERSKEWQENMAAESRLASAIVDRAFMWLFLIIFVISTIVVFLLPLIFGER